MAKQKAASEPIPDLVFFFEGCVVSFLKLAKVAEKAMWFPNVILYLFYLVLFYTPSGCT